MTIDMNKRIHSKDFSVLLRCQVIPYAPNLLLILFPHNTYFRDCHRGKFYKRFYCKAVIELLV